jgi:hypothetical protein
VGGGFYKRVGQIKKMDRRRGRSGWRDKAQFQAGAVNKSAWRDDMGGGKVQQQARQVVLGAPQLQDSIVSMKAGWVS